MHREHSQFWIIFNPRLMTDFVYRRFVSRPPANAVTRKISYTENLFLSSTMLKVIQHAKDEVVTQVKSRERLSCTPTTKRLSWHRA